MNILYKHRRSRFTFHPFLYRKKKFCFYSEQEIKADPSKGVTYGYSFVVNENAPIVFIAPGGGYQMVCMGYEGVFVAEELNRRGINAFVLNYRVGKNARAPHPQEDMAAIIKYVFRNKEKFGIKREDYSVMGFSAGGHLAASFSTENVGYSCFGVKKPKAAVLCYAVLTMGKGTHDGTMETLTGGDNALKEAYSAEKHAACYPPTYLWHCADDKAVPIEENSIAMYKKLQEYGIPCKLDVFPKGGHGLGLGYKTEAECWLDNMLSFLKEYID